MGISGTIIDVGPLEVSGGIDFIDIDLGPTLNLSQDFELTPSLMVDLKFSNPVEIEGMSGLQDSWTGLWDDLPGVAFFETTILTPEYWLEAVFTNQTGFNLSLDATWDLLELSASVKAFGEKLGSFNFSALDLLGIDNTISFLTSPEFGTINNEFLLGGFNRINGSPFTVQVASASASTPASIALMMIGFAGFCSVCSRLVKIKLERSAV